MFSDLIAGDETTRILAAIAVLYAVLALWYVIFSNDRK